MNELQIINRQNVLNKSFTVYGTIENPLFLAKDVADWIDHSDVSTMLRSVDDDEKVTNIVCTLGGNQKAWFLTENGLYEVLMLSRKPIAKQFKKEVKKILHELRTKGSYTVPKTFAEALQLAADQAKQLEIARPKAEYFDNYCNSENLEEIGHLGKVTGIGEQKIFKRLLADGIIKVRYSTDGIKSYDPCYGYEKYFKSIPVTFTTNNHTYSRDKLMLTHKGFVYFNAKYAGPKVLEETAEKFIQKGESEYQNIVDDTAKKIVENIPGAMSRFVQDAAEICKDYPLNPKGICNNKAE